MDKKRLEALLRQVSQGSLSVRSAAERLAALETAKLETDKLEYARIDHHRPLRRGIPEVVLGEGKSPGQIQGIVEHLIERRAPVLVTRLEASVGETLAERHPIGRYDPLSRTYFARSAKTRRKPRPGLVIVSAGTADLPVAEEAAVTAEAFSLVPDRIYDVGVAGLHRLLEHLPRLRQAKVVIVVAGMEGALPSVVAGLVEAPVIGVPTSVGYGAALAGFTALMGMLSSCAEGLTVVNIDNGFGAACAARVILQR